MTTCYETPSLDICPLLPHSPDQKADFYIHELKPWVLPHHWLPCQGPGPIPSNQHVPGCHQNIHRCSNCCYSGSSVLEFSFFCCMLRPTFPSFAQLTFRLCCFIHTTITGSLSAGPPQHNYILVTMEIYYDLEIILVVQYMLVTDMYLTVRI